MRVTSSHTLLRSLNKACAAVIHHQIVSIACIVGTVAIGVIAVFVMT